MNFLDRFSGDLQPCPDYSAYLSIVGHFRQGSKRQRSEGQKKLRYVGGKRDIFASIGDQYKNISTQIYADPPAPNTFFPMAAQRLQRPAGGKDQHITIDSSSQVVPKLSKASEPNLFPG